MVMAPVSDEPRTKTLQMSWEDFLQTEFDGIGEWVDGEVRIDMSVGFHHNTLTVFLIRLLSHFCDLTGAGVVRAEPYAMRTMAGKPGRLPDVFVILKENLVRVTEPFLDGPADLVVEVISPDSPRRDREEKFLEYQEGGVREYWIIDPREGLQRAEFYVLASDPVHPGRMAYRPVPIADDGTYHSTVLEGFWIRVAWLLDETADPLRCLVEMVGRERVMTLLD